MEQNKQQKEKSDEYRYHLNVFKKYVTWLVISLIIIPIVCIIAMYIHMDFIGATICTVIIAYLGYALIKYFVKSMDMHESVSKLSKEIKKEWKYVEGIKKEYALISTVKLDDLSIDLKKTAQYLLSNPEKKPYEVIAAREEEIEDMETQYRVYLGSPEKTFWQYFISWKWLKKIPK